MTHTTAQGNAEEIATLATVHDIGGNPLSVSVEFLPPKTASDFGIGVYRIGITFEDMGNQKVTRIFGTEVIEALAAILPVAVAKTIEAADYDRKVRSGRY